MSSTEPVRSMEYPHTQCVDGALVGIPAKLQGELSFDRLDLEGVPTSKKITLWFRNGAKRIFHISLMRRSGRVLIEMGGLDSDHVLTSINICKDHFDQWFRISAKDIQFYENRDSFR